MSLTLTPVLIQCVSWGICIVGGLIGLWMGILVIWLYMFHQRFTRFHRSAPPSVVGPGLESRPPELSNYVFNLYVAPRPPVWKNGRRLPPETGNLDRKPPSGSSNS